MNILEARRRMLGGEVYKKTAEGNPVSVRSLARMRPGLKLFGRSEQFTTTGAQLFDASQIKDGFVSGETIGESFSVSNNQAYPNAQYVEIDVSDIEIISWDLTDCLNGSLALRIRYFDADGTSIKTGSITAESGAVNVYDVDKIYVMAIEAFNEIAESKAMVNSGNKILPWEPYTGGQPSPSPDYPQEITSAGDDGSIQVDITGLNLLRVSGLSGDFGTYGNYNVQSETIKFSINDVSNVNFTIELSNPINIPPGDYMSISEANWSYTDESKQLQVQYLNDLSEGLPAEWYGNNNPEWKGCKQFTIDELFIITKIKIVIIKGSFQDAVYKIGIIPGNKILPWEPYKQPQSLTVQTPNGLPGIPVNSGGNYTDSTGQQWICDEIDFKRGKYVQRVIKYTGPYFLNRRVASDSWFLSATQLENTPKPEYRGFCNVSSSYISSWDNYGHSHWFLQTKKQQIVIHLGDKYNTKEAAQQFIAENEIVVYYVADTPIETDLSQEQMQAYANLHTNRPTTIVSATDDAGIKLTYKTKKSLEVTD